MDKVRLGKEIRNWRKIRGLTQLQLAKDVCHQSEVSRIEKGIVFPSVDILQLFSYKLKLPVSYFYEVLIYDDVAYKDALIKEVLQLSKKKKYKEVHDLVEMELKKNIVHPEFKKFLLWQLWSSACILKKIHLATCITELNMLLIKETLGTHLYLDLLIKNSLANFYAEDQQFKKSSTLYKEILSCEINSEGFTELRIKVYYNYGKLLFINQQYESALVHIDEGLDTSIKNNDMSLLGQLYYQKAECLEKLDHEYSVISDNYKKAALFFDLLDMDYYTSVIKDKKADYL